MTEIRILHQLASSGGTIISRCLAAMHGVALVSELHPGRYLRGVFDPFVQARIGYEDWVRQEDLDEVCRAEVDILRRLAERAERSLVLREWTHGDFFFEGADFTSRLARILSDQQPLRRVAIVRHPVDTWISMSKSKFLLFDHDEYLRRFALFAASVQGLPVLRYEDFCRDADTFMAALCREFALDFSPDYLARVPGITWVTGASGRQADVPSLRPREPIAPEDLAALTDNPRYPDLVAALGYDRDETAALPPDPA